MSTTTAATTTPPGARTPDAPRRRGSRGPRRGAVKEALTAYGFLAPGLALLATFVFVPLAGAVALSLQRTNGFGDGVWVGLENYVRLFGDPVFWRAAANTVLFTLVVTPGSMALGLGAAVLLNSVLPARGLFRSVLILPMAVSGVATALIGVLVFDENSGFANAVLRTLGLPGVSWQSGSTAAFVTVVLVTLWWRTGFNMLIYLAGLQGVGRELIEAATLDGAGAWQRFRYVIVPMLGPSSFFLVVMNVIYSFQVFDIVFVLTGGGPRNATTVLVTYAYDNGFVVRDQGYAATIGVFLLVVSLAFTGLRWRTSRTRDQVG